MSKENYRKRVTLHVADNHQDMNFALMVRVAVYVGEIGIPLDVAIDGNDFCATHIIAKVDGKPVGSMRLRFFDGVAIMERLAILKEARLKRYGGRGVAWELGEFAVNFCRLKGYTKFFGVSRDNMVEFWKKFAPKDAEFRLIEGAEVEYAGRISFPMEGDAPELPHAAKGLNTIKHLMVPEADLPEMTHEAA